MEGSFSHPQVSSRAFGSGEAEGKAGLALAPLIDLCNHSAQAAAPSLWLDPDHGGEVQYR
jgi:hypothetical protein